MAYELVILANADSAGERECLLMALARKVYPAASTRIRRFESATLAIIQYGVDGDVVAEKDEGHQCTLVLAASAIGAKAVLDGLQPSADFGAEAAHLRIEFSKREPALAITNDGLGLIRLFWAMPRPGEFLAATSLALLRG